MKEKIFILILFLFAINTTVSSQKMIPVKFKDKQILISEADITTTSDMLKKVKLDYQKPNAFREDSTHSLKRYPVLSYKLGGSNSTAICSKDNQFVSFLSGPAIYTKEFEEYLKKLFPSKEHDLVDKQHLNQMKGILKNFYGEEMAQKWMEKVITYPKEEALKKFNADNAYRLSISLAPGDYYEKDFKYVDLLFIQKKGRGYAYISSFYTDKAKAKLNKYWRKIEKALYYRD